MTATVKTVLRAAPFILSDAREAALWRLVEALQIPPTLGAYPLVRRCLAEGARLPEHADGFGAASELKFALGKGLTVKLLQRPETCEVSD